MDTVKKYYKNKSSVIEKILTKKCGNSMILESKGHMLCIYMESMATEFYSISSFEYE